MPRIQGLAESGVLTADQLLKTGEGYVFSITIAFKGVTAGDICTLKDGLTDQAADEVPFIFPATNGILTREWSQGKKFDTGIFWNRGPLGAGASVYAEVTFK